MPEGIIQRIQSLKGVSHSLLPSVPFVFDKKGTFFSFIGKPVNLFAQKKKGGSRTFLASFTSDELLFSLDEFIDHPEYEIVLIPIWEVTLFEFSIDVLEEWIAKDQEAQTGLVPCLENWVLSFALSRGDPATAEQVPIAKDQVVELEEAKALVCQKEAFVWVEVIEGTLFFLGLPDLSLSNKEGAYPLVPASWMSGTEIAKVKAIDTLTLIQNQKWRQALLSFSRVFSNRAFYLIHQRDELNHTLQVNRLSEEKENLGIALKQLEAVFAPSSLVTILETAKDPLQQALIIIGHFMKIQFVFPRSAIGEKAELLNLAERIDIICQASQIQRRKVRLDPKWWKENHGTLLGFTENENRPTPLIRLDKYKWIDKDRNEYINASLASELTENGYMFYRHFESTLRTGKEALLFFARNYYKELIKIIPIGFLGVVFALFPPIATKFLFSYAIPASDPPLILYLFFGMLFSAIGFSFFYLFQGLVYLKMEGLGAHLMQTAFWDRLLRLSPRFFRRFTVGNLFTRIFAIEDMRMMINSFGSTLPITALFTLFYLMMMFFYAPSLALIATAFAVMGLGITVVCARLKMKIIKQSLEIDGNLRGIVIQMIQGVSKLRVAGVNKSAFSYWASYFAKNNSLKLKAQNIQNVSTFFSSILPLLSMSMIYLALIAMSEESEISLSDFLAFNIAFGSFTVAVYPLCHMLIRIASVIPQWDQTKVILEEPLEVAERKIAPGKISGDIRIDHLVFGYDPTRPSVLNGLSLSVKPREYVGIVGRSGCGKSTLIRLLLGFEKPTSGVIYIDGVDLASLDLQAIRNQLGIVMQGGGIMGGTIYEILSSGGFYTQEQFDTALKLSGFDEELDTFPMGLNTVLPVNATTLSGGQRQRLLLARALMGNPSLLIFDEATSALDNATQDKIVQNLEKLPVTKIAIAQRLSTIQNADRIYVIDHGVVAQTGTFNELANQPGLFAEMLSQQKT